MEATFTHDDVRTYYGETLATSADLKTTACCSDEAVPEHHKPILSLLPDEVLSKFYGCGSPVPPALDGATVLDLGCGTGRDAFVAAALAGPTGRVIGVDMTEAQIEVAQRHRPSVADALGHPAPTTEFVLGTMEDLGALGIADGSVDVVISNCVPQPRARQGAGLCRDRPRPQGRRRALRLRRVRRPPPAPRRPPRPGLGGPSAWAARSTPEDFRRTMAALGWRDVRTVTERPVTVEDPALRDKLGNARFTSATRPGVQAAGPRRGPLRGLRPGRDLPRRRPRPGRRLCPGRPPHLRGRPAGVGLRQHGGHAPAHALRPVLRRHRRPVDPLRPVRLRADAGRQWGRGRRELLLRTRRATVTSGEAGAGCP